MPGKGTKLPAEDSGPSCVFCQSEEENEDVYGKLLKKSGITIHYFCMLFSSGLCQRGKKESDGILGFLPADIRREQKRGNRLTCQYCKRKGATIGCVVSNCRKTFHFKCGREAGGLNQFFDEFRSYCPEHRPHQGTHASVSDRLAFYGTAKSTCSICMSAVEARASNDTLRSPCCRHAWFHRDCMQHYATSAGLYFFKCPLCNNKDVFQAEMLQFGIYIPDQDAAWEQEPDAFHELLERYNHCDAQKCICPKGRKYDGPAGSRWELLLCDTCGSSGSHDGCGALHKVKKEFVCSSCLEINKTVSGKRKRKSSPPPLSEEELKKQQEQQRAAAEREKRAARRQQLNQSPEREPSSPVSTPRRLRCSQTSSPVRDEQAVQLHHRTPVVRITRAHCDMDVNVTDSDTETASENVAPEEQPSTSMATRSASKRSSTGGWNVTDVSSGEKRVLLLSSVQNEDSDGSVNSDHAQSQTASSPKPAAAVHHNHRWRKLHQVARKSTTPTKKTITRARLYSYMRTRSSRHSASEAKALSHPSSSSGSVASSRSSTPDSQQSSSTGPLWNDHRFTRSSSHTRDKKHNQESSESENSSDDGLMGLAKQVTAVRNRKTKEVASSSEPSTSQHSPSPSPRKEYISGSCSSKISVHVKNSESSQGDDPNIVVQRERVGASSSSDFHVSEPPSQGITKPAVLASVSKTVVKESSQTSVTDSTQRKTVVSSHRILPVSSVTAAVAEVTRVAVPSPMPTSCQLPPAAEHSKSSSQTSLTAVTTAAVTTAVYQKPLPCHLPVVSQMPTASQTVTPKSIQNLQLLSTQQGVAVSKPLEPAVPVQLQSAHPKVMSCFSMAGFRLLPVVPALVRFPVATSGTASTQAAHGIQSQSVYQRAVPAQLQNTHKQTVSNVAQPSVPHQLPSLSSDSVIFMPVSTSDRLSTQCTYQYGIQSSSMAPVSYQTLNVATASQMTHQAPSTSYSASSLQVHSVSQRPVSPHLAVSCPSAISAAPQMPPIYQAGTAASAPASWYQASQVPVSRHSSSTAHRVTSQSEQIPLSTHTSRKTMSLTCEPVPVSLYRHFPLAEQAAPKVSHPSQAQMKMQQSQNRSVSLPSKQLSEPQLTPTVTKHGRKRLVSTSWTTVSPVAGHCGEAQVALTTQTSVGPGGSKFRRRQAALTTVSPVSAAGANSGMPRTPTTLSTGQALPEQQWHQPAKEKPSFQPDLVPVSAFLNPTPHSMHGKVAGSCVQIPQSVTVLSQASSDMSTETYYISDTSSADYAQHRLSSTLPVSRGKIWLGEKSSGKGSEQVDVVVLDSDDDDSCAVVTETVTSTTRRVPIPSTGLAKTSVPLTLPRAGGQWHKASEAGERPVPVALHGPNFHTDTAPTYVRNKVVMTPSQQHNPLSHRPAASSSKRPSGPGSSQLASSGGEKKRGDICQHCHGVVPKARSGIRAAGAPLFIDLTDDEPAAKSARSEKVAGHSSDSDVEIIG